jgi:hypothetical protein
MLGCSNWERAEGQQRLRVIHACGGGTPGTYSWWWRRRRRRWWWCGACGVHACVRVCVQIREGEPGRAGPARPDAAVQPPQPHFRRGRPRAPLLRDGGALAVGGASIDTVRMQTLSACSLLGRAGSIFLFARFRVLMRPTRRLVLFFFGFSFFLCSLTQRCPEEEVACEQQFRFEADMGPDGRPADLTAEQVKLMIMEEIRFYHKDLPVWGSDP